VPGGSVLDSWNISLLLLLTFAATVFFYVRGWFRANAPGERLSAFLAGMVVLFIALASPLDSFSHFFLWVHMTQHVLLMMAAPLLIVSGRPWPMILRGLPKDFAQEGLGPFLKWKPLQNLTRWLSTPAVGWLFYATTLIVWHLPRLYQFALSSPTWHNVQHACFFWSGVLFWRPVINPNPRRDRGGSRSLICCSPIFLTPHSLRGSSFRAVSFIRYTT
jgi:cytochrome c oxidase assembly factor CtaG